MKSPKLLTNLICNTSLVLLLYLTFSFNINAQLKAFPTAEGAAAYITGGRGGAILHVTRLTDDAQPGSFRWALTRQYPRIIVFDVSGTIDMGGSQIFLPGFYNGGAYNDLTVLGQTAPKGGITIVNGNIRFEYSDNIIFRYIKFRGGNFGGETPSLQINRCSNVIVDHCEGWYATDEAFDLSGNEQGPYGNITVSDCLLAESKTGLIMGGLWQGQNNWSDPYGSISVLRNAFINISHRFPKAGGAFQMDVINNVVHNWEARLIRFDPDNYTVNEINNYYQSGSNSSGNINKSWSRVWMNPEIYSSGNFISEDRKPDGYDEDNGLGWTTYTDNVYPFQYDWIVDTMHPFQGATPTVMSAEEAKLYVLDNAGARHYINDSGEMDVFLDDLQELYLGYLENRSSTELLPMSSYGTQATTIESLTRPDDYYQSNIHIPEVWFADNVPAGQDHNGVAPSGYTWFEEFVNQQYSSIPVVAVDSISVSPSTADIQIPNTITLAAIINPENATTQNGVWSSSDESIATVDSNGVVTPVSVGVVTITFTLIDNNVEFTATSEITVFPEALQASAGSDQQICDGESTSLIATGGTSYVWDTGETTDTIEVSPLETTTYTVTVSDDYGQTEEASVTVTVNPIPTAFAGEDQTICEGDTITLTATGGTSYIWSTGETTESIEVNPIIETIYDVEVISNNCSAIDSVTVFVNEAPDITITEDLVIVEGNTATLTASGVDNYEWNTGETTESITVQPSITTTYSVTSLGENGCYGYSEVTVTVIPEIIAEAGEDVTICSGDSITLVASGGTSYTWDNGETGSELIVNPTETTTYTVTAEDDYGFTDTDTVTVFVNELPEITVDADLFIMIGNSATITVSGGISYLWDTGETTATITVSPDITTTYTVTAQSENGCERTVEVLITVVEVLSANAGDDAAICLGDSYTINASGGISYTWNTGDLGASFVVSPTETTTYSVTVTDGYGNVDTDDITITVNPVPVAYAGEDQIICNGETITLTAEGGDTYLWSTGETSASIDVNPNTDTTYTVEVFSNDCSDIDEVIITVLPSPEIIISEDIVIMLGNSTTLDVSGGDAFLWNTGETSNSLTVSPAETTTYSVTSFLDNGCQSDAQVTVTVVPQVIANAGDDVTICNGESITLNATGSTNYLWNTGDIESSPTFSPTETTTYTVTVSDDYGNSDTDSITVTVNDVPNVAVSEDITINEGENTTLIANGAETYLWSTNDTTDSIVVSPTQTTTYSVIGYSDNGCSSEVEVTVTVIPELIANAGDDIAICIGDSVTLNASGGTGYTWNTGDTSASITLTPSVTTTYTVTVTDDYGNSDSDNVTITVNELPTITISEDVIINEGESTTLIANGTETYVWNTGETTSSIIVTPTQTTTYSVVGYSPNGCSNEVEVTVTVIPELVANAGSDVAICIGESVTLNASGGTGYLWNTGHTTATPTFTPSETAVYTVTVTDDYGNSDTDSVTVTVNELPSLSISNSITILEGESTNLTVSGAETYLWNTGNTSNTINVSPTQTTTYIVTGSTSSCTADAQVTVYVEPLFVASAGEDKNVCDNETYEVVLTANQGDSYIWSTGETSQSIVVSPTSTSTYSVTVTQGDQQDTDDVTVYVNPSPEVVIANGESVEILNGDFITLSASGAESYEWNNGASQPNIAVSPSVTTTYEVKGYIGTCFDEKQVTVNVLEPVIASAGEDVYICLNDVAILTASGGDEYVWSTGETTQSIEVSPLETTEYTVTVFNALDFDEATVTVDVDVDCIENATVPVDDASNFSFDIYPNPAKDILNVKLSGGALIVSGVHIYDLTGKLIQSTIIENEDLNPNATRQIDISALQTGVYFVKLIDLEREVTKKLIVK